MTTITATMKRDLSLDMFADLTSAAIVEWSYDGPTLTLTFDAELDEATVAAITDRMTTATDSQAVKAAALRTELANLRDPQKSYTTAKLRAAVATLYAYILEES